MTNVSNTKNNSQEDTQVDIIGLAYEDARRKSVTNKQSYLKVIAPAKVNLYLEVSAKRPDGYHGVNNVMHTLLLHDTLYLRCLRSQEYALETGASLEGEGVSVRITTSFSPLISAQEIPLEDNLIYKAIMLLAEKAQINDHMLMDVHVEKCIPSQAGLGGGSSDAAAALVAAAQLWGIEPTSPLLTECAQELGADVAFFLSGGCALFDNKGERFVKQYTTRNDAVLLVKPDAGCSTAEIYSLFDNEPALPNKDITATFADAQTSSEIPFFNGLEASAQSLVPELANIASWLESEAGVSNVMLTGSGSCIFAVCESSQIANNLAVQARKKQLWAAPSFFINARAAAKRA